MEDDKNVDNSTEIKNQPATYFDEYYNIRQRDKIPMTLYGIDMLCDDFYNWGADSDGAVCMSDFYLRKGIPQKTFYNWCQRSEKLGQVYKIVKELISNRRELRGLDRTFDPGMVRYTAPRYSNAYKKLEEWRAGLRDKKDDSGGTKIVVMERFALEKETKNEPETT